MVMLFLVRRVNDDEGARARCGLPLLHPAQIRLVFSRGEQAVMSCHEEPGNVISLLQLRKLNATARAAVAAVCVMLRQRVSLQIATRLSIPGYCVNGAR